MSRYTIIKDLNVFGSEGVDAPIDEELVTFANDALRTIPKVADRLLVYPQKSAKILDPDDLGILLLPQATRTKGFPVLVAAPRERIAQGLVHFESVEEIPRFTKIHIRANDTPSEGASTIITLGDYRYVTYTDGTVMDLFMAAWHSYALEGDIAGGQGFILTTDINGNCLRGQIWESLPVKYAVAFAGMYGRNNQFDGNIHGIVVPDWDQI